MRRRRVGRAAADVALLVAALAARRRWVAAGWALVLVWDLRVALA